MRNPLIVTRSETLLDDLLRLSAAAGVVPEVATDPRSALRSWVAAPLVLVGVDAVEELVRIGPPRRARVHLVGVGKIADDIFRYAVALGAENVTELPGSDSWVLELLSDMAEGPPGVSTTIGVVGGSGGSGATTFACALGLAAASRTTTCLVDADPHGPGADRVLGFDRMDGLRWDVLEQTTGRVSARSLREALPRRHGLGVLTWSPGSPGALQPFAAREALAAAARGHGVVVVDLPRQGGTLAEEMMARCQHLVVMVRTTVAGLTSAARFVSFAEASGPVGLVLRGGGLEPAEATRLVGAPVLASMSDQRGLDEAVDLGLGPVRSRRSVLARAADDVLTRLVPVVADEGPA